MKVKSLEFLIHYSQLVNVIVEPVLVDDDDHVYTGTWQSVYHSVSGAEIDDLYTTTIKQGHKDVSCIGIRAHEMP